MSLFCTSQGLMWLSGWGLYLRIRERTHTLEGKRCGIKFTGRDRGSNLWFPHESNALTNLAKRSLNFKSFNYLRKSNVTWHQCNVDYKNLPSQFKINILQNQTNYIKFENKSIVFEKKLKHYLNLDAFYTTVMYKSFKSLQ